MARGPEPTSPPGSEGRLADDSLVAQCALYQRRQRNAARSRISLRGNEHLGIHGDCELLFHAAGLERIRLRVNNDVYVFQV